MVQGCTKIPEGECHRHENSFGNETTKTKLNRTFVTNGYLAWMLAGVQTNHGSSSVHVQWFSHQNGGADNHDVIL